jgi:hypothetical protein
METYTLSLGQCWIARAFGRNPLVRLSDRMEALAAVLVFAAALVVTPVAGAIGTAVYDSRARMYAVESHTRHTISGTVIEDSTVVVIPRDAEAFRAPVRWQADGVEHIDSVMLDHATTVGDQVDVWVDAAGNQAPAPTPAWRAGLDAVGAGAAAWAGMMAGIALAFVLVRVRLARRRSLSWERELHALVSDDGGLTGRQT